MSAARSPSPSLDPVAPDRARRPRPRRSARRLTSRRVALGVRRRRWTARLPVGPVLLVVAAGLTLASLRASPAELGLDPASAAHVVVATVELPSGSVVDPDDIEVRAYPAAAVPPTSAAQEADVVGRQVTATILEGEPVVGARLAPDGLVGIAAAVPPSWSAFTLGADANVPDADLGQRVDLYALDATDDLATAEPGSTRVASDALVVAVDEDGGLTVAVRAADAPDVAAALIASTVVVAITGPAVEGAERPEGS